MAQETLYFDTAGISGGVGWNNGANIEGQYDVATANSVDINDAQYAGCSVQNRSDAGYVPSSIDNFLIKTWDYNSEHADDTYTLEFYDAYAATWRVLQTWNSGSKLPTSEPSATDYASTVDSYFPSGGTDQEKKDFVDGLQVRWACSKSKGADLVNIATTGLSCTYSYAAGALTVNVGDDNPTVTDEVTALIPFYLANVGDDNPTVQDWVDAKLSLFLASPFDLVGVSDDVTVAVSLSVSVFDLVGASDEGSALTTLIPSVFDLVAMSDEINALTTPLLASAEDDVGLTDDAQGNVIATGTLSAYVWDYVYIHPAYRRPSVSDDIGLTDDASAVITGAGTLEASVYDDNPTVTDEVSVSIPVLQVNVADNLGLTDEQFVSLPVLAASANDNVGISDETTLLVPILEANIFDNVGLTDAGTPALDKYLASVSDLVGLTDEITISLGALTVSVFDNVILLDEQIVSIPVLLVSVSENVALTDAVDALFNLFQVTVNDGVTVTDYVGVLLNPLVANVFDVVGIAEVLDMHITTEGVLEVAVGDTLVVVDSAEVAKVIPGVIAYDTVQLTDAVSIRRLPEWAVPTESSSVDWSKVSEASSATWAKVDDSSSADWRKV